MTVWASNQRPQKSLEFVAARLSNTILVCYDRDFQMSIQDIWERLLRRLRLKPSSLDIFGEVDELGLLRNDLDADRQDEQSASSDTGTQVLVRKAADKTQSLERLQEGFNRLIGQLEGINENLAQQARQQQDLIDKMSQLPKVVESFPSAITNQQRMIEHLSEQMETAAAANRQFTEAVKKIPDEAMRQTDALHSINRQLSALGDTDMVMNENFAKFNGALERLNASSVSQTDSVVQMSKTFAASDRYLKYLVARQNKRFMWIFFTAMGVCVFAILALITIIVFMKR
jgi:chromosome segregation ATPase